MVRVIWLVMVDKVDKKDRVFMVRMVRVVIVRVRVMSSESDSQQLPTVTRGYISELFSRFQNVSSFPQTCLVWLYLNID